MQEGKQEIENVSVVKEVANELEFEVIKQMSVQMLEREISPLKEATKKDSIRQFISPY